MTSRSSYGKIKNVLNNTINFEKIMVCGGSGYARNRR